MVGLHDSHGWITCRMVGLHVVWLDYIFMVELHDSDGWVTCRMVGLHVAWLDYMSHGWIACRMVGLHDSKVVIQSLLLF